MAILEAKPKYKQMKEILLERIYSGEYQPESRFPTENELVKEFGVSKHTVLKTLGELVNENFLYRRQGSGTFVKNFKKKSKQGKTSTVAFLYYGDTKLNMPLPSLQLFSGFEKALRSDGRFEISLVCTNGVPENEIKAINRLASSVEGIAILTHFRKGQAHPAVDLLKKKKIPFVSILVCPNEIYLDKINFAASDDFSGGALAAEYFIDKACDEVFMIMPEHGKYSIVNYDRRLAGCLQGLKASKIKAEDKNVLKIEVKDGNFSFEKAGYKAASKIIELMGKGKRAGIFALMSDQVACGIIKRLKEEKGIIKDTVICGYDNMPESSEWANNFTSVESSISDIGHRGALILLNNIESGSQAELSREILPVKLIKRAI